MILRGLLLAAGLAALGGSLVLERPERFGVTAPAGLLVIVLAAGAVAADAVPLRRRALACSLASGLLGVLLVVLRGEVQIPVAAGIVLAQVLAVAPPVRVVDRHPPGGV